MRQNGVNSDKKERDNANSKLMTSVNMFNSTMEEAEKLIQEINNLQQEKKEVENTTPQELWKQDIDDFLTIYLKKYPKEKDRISQ